MSTPSFLPSREQGTVDAAVSVVALSHYYPRSERPALCEVTFEVRRGERVGLLGPNGAGKTTLMRILSGFLPVRAQSGRRVQVVGHDMIQPSRRGHAAVGYLPEHVPLYTELRVREHLQFRARIKGMGRRVARDEIGRVARRTALDDVLDVPIFELSKGYRQRVGIADALLGSPALLMLDEPTVGLDPNQILDIRATLRDVDKGQTLILSTHILGEVEMLCDRVVILDRGRVVADEDLDQALPAAAVIAEWAESEPDRLDKILRRALGECGLDEGVDVEFRHDAPYPYARIVHRRREGAVGASEALLAAIGRASAEQGIAMRRLQVERSRLEQRFAQVTGAAREGQLPS